MCQLSLLNHTLVPDREFPNFDHRTPPGGALTFYHHVMTMWYMVYSGVPLAANPSIHMGVSELKIDSYPLFPYATRCTDHSIERYFSHRVTYLYLPFFKSVYAGFVQGKRLLV